VLLKPHPKREKLDEGKEIIIHRHYPPHPTLPSKGGLKAHFKFFAK